MKARVHACSEMGAFAGWYYANYDFIRLQTRGIYAPANIMQTTLHGLHVVHSRDSRANVAKISQLLDFSVNFRVLCSLLATCSISNFYKRIENLKNINGTRFLHQVLKSLRNFVIFIANNKVTRTSEDNKINS